MSVHPLISNAPLNLSYEELVELTHFKLASKQARALNLMGFTFKVRPDRSVALLREHVQKMMGGVNDTKGDGRSRPKNVIPNWEALNVS